MSRNDETRLADDRWPLDSWQEPLSCEALACPAPLREGQHRLLESLFNKQRGPLLRHLTYLLGSADDAAEILQESFYRLVRQAHTTRFEALAHGYLFQTATNLARDHFRRRAVRHRDRHVPLEDAAEVADDVCLETSAICEQTLGRVKSGLQEMPRKLREVFVLSRFEGRTYPEIARALAVSTRTVERRMTEALEFLTARAGEAR